MKNIYGIYSRNHSGYLYYGLSRDGNSAQIRVELGYYPQVRRMVAHKLKGLRKTGLKVTKLSYDAFYARSLFWDWRGLPEEYGRQSI